MVANYNLAVIMFKQSYDSRFQTTHKMPTLSPGGIEQAIEKLP